MVQAILKPGKMTVVFAALIVWATTSLAAAQETAQEILELPTREQPSREQTIPELSKPESLRHSLTIIAHRGASGYAPEHTLPAVAIAHAQHADFIEQDVVLTRDHVPVVLHDLRLDAVTNVADVFPEKYRPDGHYYVMDFSFAELQQLKVNERRNKDGKQRYPDRFSSKLGHFHIMSLAQQIELILGLNASSGRDTGIYVEMKSARWHKKQNYDLVESTMGVLARYDFTQVDTPAPIYLQSFDPEVLRRLKREFRTEIPLIQLVAENSWNESDIDYDMMRTAAGLETLRSYASGVGVWLNHIFLGFDEHGNPQFSDIVKHAHAAGLLVHVYTLRADDLPEGVASYQQLKTWLTELGVDGIFTDFPDR
ncbi:glycerophosphodiester phosphodiesterase [Pseudidiomarina donghaiensis]|uniref:glycerophosphodiester phosphodiesterase n=1 Tax=Pseudidiomarina donghaiensis TaxID=519452 RepID=UPI003A97D947